MNVIRLLLLFALLLFGSLGINSGVAAHSASPRPTATHMLVVFPEGAKRPTDAKLARALRRLPAENWFVSVSRSDGSIAPYSPAASLQHTLRQPSPAAHANENANLSIEGAVKGLEGFEGLKILIVDVSGVKGNRTTSWIDLLTKARVSAYIVDGGKLQEVCYEASWGYSRGPSPQGCDFLNKRVRFEQDGILHEVKFADAVRDALRRGR